MLAREERRITGVLSSLSLFEDADCAQSIISCESAVDLAGKTDTDSRGCKQWHPVFAFHLTILPHSVNYRRILDYDTLR